VPVLRDCLFCCCNKYKPQAQQCCRQAPSAMPPLNPTHTCAVHGTQNLNARSLSLINVKLHAHRASALHLDDLSTGGNPSTRWFSIATTPSPLCQSQQRAAVVAPTWGPTQYLEDCATAATPHPDLGCPAYATSK